MGPGWTVAEFEAVSVWEVGRKLSENSLLLRLAANPEEPCRQGQNVLNVGDCYACERLGHASPAQSPEFSTCPPNFRSISRPRGSSSMPSFSRMRESSSINRFLDFPMNRNLTCFIAVFLFHLRRTGKECKFSIKFMNLSF